MADIPHGVLSDHLQQQLAGRRPIAAAFLTYTFEPGFFEQEVLPLLFDVPLGQARVVRLLRLAEELRRMPGQVAVYYDMNGLVTGDEAPVLGLGLVPIRHPTGIFHPKMWMILCEASEPDEGGRHAQSLIVGCSSANLTRAGWWENVEVCHTEVLEEGDRTRMREDLLRALAYLRRGSAPGTDHTALEHIGRFLRRTESRGKRSSDGKLHTHLYVGSEESFTDFLDELTRGRLKGCYLEVLSPYFDDRPKSMALQRLLERFEPKETRVFLPWDHEGRAGVNERLHASLAEIGDVSWGRLEEGFARLGRARDAAQRFMHAKVYRFFRQAPKFELLVVGSVNLTLFAHERGGNFEAAFVVEHEPVRRPDFWLTPDTRRPTDFKPAREADEAASDRGVPLLVRFTWRTRKAEVWWESAQLSPGLRLEANGIEVAALAPVSPRAWQELPSEASAALESELLRTSFLTVHGHGKEPGVILVQEEGMPYKPPLLATLSARDILEYWALLTSEQKQEFLESRYAEVLAMGAGAELIVRNDLSSDSDSMFDRFAGIFHAFDCMERAVREHLKKDNPREAEYRLFGMKHDSLRKLLSQVLDSKDMDDDIQRYVVLLCAKQVRQEVVREFPEFWAAHREEVRALDDQLARLDEVRIRLQALDRGALPRFLEWLEPWFLKRAERLETEQPA